MTLLRLLTFSTNSASGAADSSLDLGDGQAEATNPSGDSSSQIHCWPRICRGMRALSAHKDAREPHK